MSTPAAAATAEASTTDGQLKVVQDATCTFCGCVCDDIDLTVKDNPNVQIAEYPDNGYFYIGFNLREGHLYADKALREAFSMCIDHVKTVEVGQA